MDNLTGRELKAMFSVVDKLKAANAKVVKVLFWHGAYYIASDIIIIRIMDRLNRASVTSFKLSAAKKKLSSVKVGDLARIDAGGFDVNGDGDIVNVAPFEEVDERFVARCNEMLDGCQPVGQAVTSFYLNMSMLEHVLSLVDAFKLANKNIPCSIEMSGNGQSNKIIGVISDQSKASTRGTNIYRGEMEIKFTFMTNLMVES